MFGILQMWSVFVLIVNDIKFRNNSEAMKCDREHYPGRLILRIPSTISIVLNLTGHFNRSVQMVKKSLGEKLFGHVVVVAFLKGTIFSCTCSSFDRPFQSHVGNSRWRPTSGSTSG